MSVIPASEARNLFTKALIATYKERVQPTGFLRSFFRNVESATKYLSIEVMRGTEKIAVDVLRGTEGNRNTFSKSTEKVIEPPYYREYFDITELDLYDRLFGSTDISTSVMAQFVEDVAMKMVMLIDKIERSLELQAAQVMLTGIVTVADGTNIDFKRKAASLVDGSATTWATGTNDPYAQIAAGIKFLRTVGKSTGSRFHVIMGSLAADAFFANAIVKARGPLSNINFDSLRAPQRNATGAADHGEVTAGSNKAMLWTYPQYYDDASGTSTEYIDPKKIIILPENPNMVMGFGAVPQLIDTSNPTVKKGAFIVGDYVDQRKHAHIYDVRSAGVAIPVAVDQIYTRQVLA